MKKLIVLLGLAGSACGPTATDLSALVSEAGACAPGDTCVIAGLMNCFCGGPVNTAREAEVNAFAATVNCGGLSVSCAPGTNPRCGPNGQCIAD